jgi:epoxyqueuosine reductase
MAQDAGFSQAGISPIPTPGENFEAYLETWIELGHAGEMEYLKRRDEANRLLRSSLRIAVPWARSVIVCAVNYNLDAPKSIDPASPEAAWIARYACTGHEQTGAPSDYHDVLLARLKNLDHTLQQRLGPFQSRCYVDTGPVVERLYAKFAGIGWIGKNTCIINQQLGSWLFLGVSYGCPLRAVQNGREPLHLLPHHREAGLHPRGTARTDGPPGLRLRHLPGRVPLESPRADQP